MAGRYCLLSISLAMCTSTAGREDPLRIQNQSYTAVKNVSSPDVLKVIRSVDRLYFQNKEFLYENSSRVPVYIGYGYYCETPELAARILTILEPYLKRPHSNILEIGTGSGYLTVCMNHLLHKRSRICSLEINLKLLNRTLKTVDDYYASLGKIFNREQTQMMWWNGKRGIHSRSPFDVIYFSGILSDMEYNKLMYQINSHGILIGYDWEVDEQGTRTLWLKQWHKLNEMDVLCSPVVKCDHYYRDLMKNKAMLKLNDKMGDLISQVNMDKHGRVIMRDEDGWEGPVEYRDNYKRKSIL